MAAPSNTALKIGIRTCVEDAIILVKEHDSLPLTRDRDRRNPAVLHLAFTHTLRDEPCRRIPDTIRIQLSRIWRRHTEVNVAPRGGSLHQHLAIRVEYKALNPGRTRVHDDYEPLAHRVSQTSGLTMFNGFSPSRNRRISSAIILE